MSSQLDLLAISNRKRVEVKIVWNGELFRNRDASLGQSQNCTAALFLAVSITTITAIGVTMVNTSSGGWHLPPTAMLLACGAGVLFTLGWMRSRERQSSFKSDTSQLAAMATARRFNPVLDFHHPEVCREMLAQQIAFCERRNTPLSYIELRLCGLQENGSGEWRQLSAMLARRVKAASRTTDCLLRWSENSWLLVMPELTEHELPAAAGRLMAGLHDWLRDRFSDGQQPELMARAVSSTAPHNLAAAADILREVQTLLDTQSFSASPCPSAQQLQMPLRNPLL